MLSTSMQTGKMESLLNLKQFQLQAEINPLKVTGYDTRKVDSLIMDYHAAISKNAKSFRYKKNFDNSQLKLLCKLIKAAVIQLGYILN
jgi:hypothetical protein